MHDPVQISIERRPVQGGHVPYARCQLLPIRWEALADFRSAEPPYTRAFPEIRTRIQCDRGSTFSRARAWRCLGLGTEITRTIEGDEQTALAVKGDQTVREVGAGMRGRHAVDDDIRFLRRYQFVAVECEAINGRRRTRI